MNEVTTARADWQNFNGNKTFAKFKWKQILFLSRLEEPESVPCQRSKDLRASGNSKGNFENLYVDIVAESLAF